MRRFLSAAGLSGLLLLLAAPGVHAGVLFVAPNITGVLNSTGSFELILQNTGPDIAVGGFSFGIFTSNPGITFTGVSTATTLPYIFGGDSLFGPEISITTGTSLTASDNPALALSYNVASGATVALGRVSYAIGPGAVTGPFAIQFNVAAGSLVDANGIDIAGTKFQDGSLNVSQTPEPGTWGMIGAALALLGMGRVRRSRSGE